MLLVEANVEPSSCVEGSSDEYEDVVGGGDVVVVVALSLSSRVRLRLPLDEAVAKAVTLLLLKAAFPASPVVVIYREEVVLEVYIVLKSDENIADARCCCCF